MTRTAPPVRKATPPPPGSAAEREAIQHRERERLARVAGAWEDFDLPAKPSPPAMQSVIKGGWSYQALDWQARPRRHPPFWPTVIAGAALGVGLMLGAGLARLVGVPF